MLRAQAFGQPLVELHGGDRGTQRQQAAGGLPGSGAHLHDADAGADAAALHKELVDPLRVRRAPGVVVVDGVAEEVPPIGHGARLGRRARRTGVPFPLYRRKKNAGSGRGARPSGSRGWCRSR
jgi:hypothetical protein